MNGYWRHLAAQAQDRSASRLAPAPRFAPAWPAPGGVEPPAAAPAPRRAFSERGGEGPAAFDDGPRESRGEDRTEARLTAPNVSAGRADAPPSAGPARPSTFPLPQAGVAGERAPSSGREVVSSRASEERRAVPDPELLPAPRPRAARTDAARARPAAAAAAARVAEDGNRSHALAAPDVHIHIGRVELTALAAPAPLPARSRTPAVGKSLSLDDYLHGKRRR